MPTALVIGLGSHGQSVKDYFVDTLSQRGVTGWACDLQGSDDPAAAAQAAEDGTYQLLIRSRTDVEDYLTYWQQAFDAGVPVLNAHQSNSYLRLERLGRLYRQVIAVGAEDPTDSDGETSYGPGLELDALSYDDNIAQSWATPTAAAVLVDFYEQVGDWQDARALLRQACTGYSSGWAEDGGFGVLPHDATIPTSVEPQAPFAASATKKAGGGVALSWTPFRTSGFARSVVTDGDGNIIYEGSAEQVTFSPPSTGDYTFKLFAEDASGTRSAEQPFSVKALTAVEERPPQASLSREGRSSSGGTSVQVSAPALKMKTDAWRLDKAEEADPFAEKASAGFPSQSGPSFEDQNITASGVYRYRLVAETPVGDVRSEVLYTTGEPAAGLPAAIW